MGFYELPTGAVWRGSRRSKPSVRHRSSRPGIDPSPPPNPGRIPLRQGGRVSALCNRRRQSLLVMVPSTLSDANVRAAANDFFERLGVCNVPALDMGIGAGDNEPVLQRRLRRVEQLSPCRSFRNSSCARSSTKRSGRSDHLLPASYGRLHIAAGTDRTLHRGYRGVPERRVRCAVTLQRVARPAGRGLGRVLSPPCRNR